MFPAIFSLIANSADPNEMAHFVAFVRAICRFPVNIVLKGHAIDFNHVK